MIDRVPRVVVDQQVGGYRRVDSLRDPAVAVAVAGVLGREGLKPAQQPAPVLDAEQTHAAHPVVS
jgi:hypothetical protein